MSACPSLAGQGGTSIGAALRAADCATGEATAAAFGRLFGADGRLLPALTLLLTLYVAIFAIGLLTGRSRLGLGALTPRMLTLGLVLTFTTSWMAYQNVVWQLATGAPDQIASVIAGTRGSATIAFADQLDRLFETVAAAADQASVPAAPTATGITPATPMVGGFTAATVLWLSALMLLLGTVGVLVTAKIALAALLALGPVFIVLALFPGTRGLFEGWLKAVALAALVPLLAVLIGGGAVLALTPVAHSIALSGTQPDTRGVGVLFLGASVYLALMVMATKTAATMVAGWRLPMGRGREARDGDRSEAPSPRMAMPGPLPALSDRAAATDERVRSIVAALPATAPMADRLPAGRIGGGLRGAEIISIDGTSIVTRSDGRRAPSVGSRFRTRAPAPSRKHAS